mgnify:CR=1 FL=1
MNCHICEKDLYVEADYDEREAHALQHLSSESRSVAGVLVKAPQVAAEISAAFCPKCGAFRLLGEKGKCGHG